MAYFFFRGEAARRDSHAELRERTNPISVIDRQF